MKKSHLSSLILSLFIFTTLIFPYFILGEDAATFIAKAAWSLVIASFAYFIFKGGKISKFRATIFVISAWAFLFQFKLFSPKIQDVPYCHVAIASTLLNFIHNQYLALSSGRWGIFGPLTLGFLWLAITFILGQAWCSWVCFYGGLDEGFSRVLKKPILKFKLPNKLRDFSFAFAIFIILVSFTAALPIFCLWVCPLKATTQFLDTTDILIRHFQLAIFLTVAVFFLVIFPLLIKKRTFCSFLCPFGAFISFFGQINPFRVTINPEKCIKCMVCIEKCPVFAINEENLRQGKVLNYCNRCGECIDICPTQAINITLLGKDIKLADRFPKILIEIFDARAFLIISCLLIMGAISNLFVPQAFIKLVRMLF